MARAARKTGMALAGHILGLAWAHPGTARLRGGITAAAGAGLAVAFATYNPADPSLNAAGALHPSNALGGVGATLADLGVQSLGLASALLALTVVVLGLCRAAASDPDASRGPLRLRALAGAAGVLYFLCQTQTYYDTGTQLGLIAFTAAVLGGIGNLTGAVVGALLIGIIQAINEGGAHGLGQEWSQTVVFLILIILMVFKPEGIFGRRTTEKV